VGVSLFGLNFTTKMKGNSVFEEEIQANGLPKFYWAFTHNELDYFQFYPEINQSQAEKTFKPVCSTCPEKKYCVCRTGTEKKCGFNFY
jgi:hypothetical protein